jgi:hypothetical protein
MCAMVNGHCSAFGNWKIKKRRCFVNTIASWQMPVRHSLRNLQRCRAFIAAFTSEKQWMMIKKVYSAIGNGYRIFSAQICQSLYDVKPKAQLERCAPYCTIDN